MYQVVLLNDDYTPMEFVVVVIQEFFNKDRETATQIMLKIHLDGKGICGVFSRDVAATKVDQVLDAAKQAERKIYDCPGIRSRLAHGLCRGTPATPRVHHC